jgi:hypothetical protein
MKQLCLLVLYLVISSQLWGQESVIQNKITLNSGEVYVGEILVKTNEMVMIKTANGKRYQFQLSEVKMIEQVMSSGSLIQSETDQSEKTDHAAFFCGDIELSGAIANTSNSFKSAPSTEISLIFGNKNVARKDFYVGFGAGYSMIFLANSTDPISYLPVFIRLQSMLNKARTAPFIGIDAGYSFGLNAGYGGGPAVKVSVGLNHKTGYKSDIYAGVFGSLTSISARITETNDLGTFSYNGSTSMTNFGLKFGLHF